MYNMTISILNAPILEVAFQKAYPTAQKVGDYTFNLTAEMAPHAEDLAAFGATITEASETVTKEVKVSKVPVAEKGYYASLLPKRGRKPKAAAEVSSEVAPEVTEGAEVLEPATV